MYDKLRRIRESKAEDDRGFTLIELLVVVVIIGILVAIAIPIYLNYQKDAQKKSVKSDIRNAVTAVEACYSVDNTWPATATANDAAPTAALCTSQSMVASDGNTITYTPGASDSFTVTGEHASDTDTQFYYLSSNGQIQDGTPDSSD